MPLPASPLMTALVAGAFWFERTSLADADEISLVPAPPVRAAVDDRESPRGTASLPSAVVSAACRRVPVWVPVEALATLEASRTVIATAPAAIAARRARSG